MSSNRVVNDAFSNDESDKWKEAMDQKYDALIKNSTWTLTELPSNVKPIQTRWVLKKKNEPNGIPFSEYGTRPDWWCAVLCKVFKCPR